MVHFKEDSKMFKILIFINFCNSFTSSSIIDYDTVKVLTINETNSYFGYSILLQHGNPPIAIIGAPATKHGRDNTGSLYKCNLNDLSCEKYRSIAGLRGISVISVPGKNGAFFGSAIDGDDTSGGNFFTCAPRLLTSSDDKKHYFTRGTCFYFRNSSNIRDVPTILQPLSEFPISSSFAHKTYYDAAFGEAGFSLLYSKVQKELLVGAPGKSDSDGALILSQYSQRETKHLFQQRDFNFHYFNYFGYAVAWGKFIKGSQRIWYVSGGPKGKSLKGNVYFYELSSRDIKREFVGETYGSYFGASLLVIHGKDGGDDILVGAPMYAGSSWDEGSVYYYKNKKDGTFYPPTKLSTKKTSSRFGTVMADVGDIDLDSFPDCAISAPFEDGTGAVYLYFGTKEGFSNEKFNRITPSEFTVGPGSAIRGFGLGISRGTDIDNDKHNDIAIGAYQSGQVFYFKTNPIIDVNLHVKPDINILFTSSTQLRLTYCTKFSFRNGNRIAKRNFLIHLLMEDDRVLSKKSISEVVTLEPYKIECRDETVLLKEDHLNTEPLIVQYGYKLNNTNENLTESRLTIPVSYKCGTDNICRTNLGINVAPLNLKEIIIGDNNELILDLSITNSGESAYQTKLNIIVPPEISLINLRECDLENGTYVCLISQMLKGTVKKRFLFDLTNLQPNRSDLPLNLKVSSIGQEVDPSDNERQLDVPVRLLNNPYIDSRSFPQSVVFNSSRNMLQIKHVFLVGNQGPSPLYINLGIFVPEIQDNGTDLLKIESVEAFANGVGSGCDLLKTKLPNVTPTTNLQTSNDTEMVSCFRPAENCITIRCGGGFYPKSNENAMFILKLTLDTDVYAKKFRNINKVAITSTAYFTNGTQEFSVTASTLIYRTIADSHVPLWIYIISTVAGVILLMLLIFTLYKCNFFQRTYKEKLENEQLESEGFLEEDQDL